MSPAELHADSIVIDGLIIAKWNRELFEDMRKGCLLYTSDAADE